MTARSIGGFLLTLVALGYLIGGFESGVDFLVVAFISVVVGAGAAMWLERDTRRQSPDVFDERATRRAVRRGIARTSLAAVAWLAVAAVVVNILTTIWQTRGDRPEHFQLVATHGFNAANPGFERLFGSGCCSVGLRSLELGITAEPRTASGLGTPTLVRLKLDLRGRLEDQFFGLPRTGVDVALEGAPTKQRLRKLLERAPDQLVAIAVVELARPLTADRFYALLARHGTVYPESSEVAVYLQPRDFWSVDGDVPESRLSWPTPALAGFQRWAKQLRRSDDRLLDDLRLHSSERLKAIAVDPRIHGFILDRASPAQLRDLLSDDAVRSVAVGDTSFDLGGAP